MPNTVRVEIRIPLDEWLAAKEIARKHDRSLASLIRVLLAKVVADDSAIAIPPQSSTASHPCQCQ